MAVNLPSLWHTALDLLSPRLCVGCAAPAASALCDGCRDDCLHPGAACRRCALPQPGAATVCGRCAVAPPAWSSLLAACPYAFPVDAMLARLKYRGDLSVAPALEVLIGHLSLDALPAFAALVPMPLHRRRLRQRGFNQALLLARPLASRAGRPLRPSWLARRRNTPPQVGLSAAARRRNLDGAFVAAADVAGRRVCLVDDVVTTGATLSAATRALVAAGATRVDCVVLARAAGPAQAGA